MSKPLLTSEQITSEMGSHSVVIPPLAYPLKKFPDGWGIRIEVHPSLNLASPKISALLTELKDRFGFVLLVCEESWKSAEPVFEQRQKSADLQIPHLEYIRVPTCAIQVPAGKPIRRSQTLLLAEEVYKNCLACLADELGEEVVRHNGSLRLPSWINNHSTLHKDSPRFTEILLEEYSKGIYIHNWSPDHNKTQILILCNNGDQDATTYHCRFGAAHDIAVQGSVVQNLFVKKLGLAVEPGDFVRA